MSRFPGTRAASARLATRRRSPRRGGAISIVGGDFSAAIATAARNCGETGVYRIAEWWRNAPDLPDGSSCYSSAGGRLLLCMGLFSIFLGSAPSQAQIPGPSPPASA